MATTPINLGQYKNWQDFVSDMCEQAASNLGAPGRGPAIFERLLAVPEKIVADLNWWIKDGTLWFQAKCEVGKNRLTGKDIIEWRSWSFSAEQLGVSVGV